MYHLRGYEFLLRLKYSRFSSSSSSCFFLLSFSFLFRSLSSFLRVTTKYVTIFLSIDTDLLNAHTFLSFFASQFHSLSEKLVRDVFILVKSVSHPFFWSLYTNSKTWATEDVYTDTHSNHWASNCLCDFFSHEGKTSRREKKGNPKFHSMNIVVRGCRSE